MKSLLLGNHGNFRTGVTLSGDSLLLDSFPDAAFAYSLNKLRSNYSGNCLRIRRGSDNQELDIGFSGKQINLSAIASFCGASTGNVVTWYDQTTNNVNATQTIASRQPQIYNATGLPAGQVYNASNVPAISFLSSTIGIVGHVLEMDPWYADTESFVSYFISFDFNSGFAKSLIGSTPHERGFVTYANGNMGTTSSLAVLTRRNLTRFAGGPTNINDLANVCHVSANRSRIKAYINLDDTAYVDIADGNENFVMPTKVWIGTSNNASSSSGRQYMGDVIGFKTDVSSTQKAIRQSIYDLWVV